MWQKPTRRWKTLKRGIILQVRWDNTMGTDSVSLAHSQARKRNCVQFFIFYFAELDGWDSVHWLTRPAATQCRAKMAETAHTLPPSPGGWRPRPEWLQHCFFSWSSVFEFLVNCLLTSVSSWPHPCLRGVCWLASYSQDSSRIGLGSTRKIQLLL